MPKGVESETIVEYQNQVIMAKCKNKASLIGTVGKDAIAKTTASGVPYTRFSLATSKGGYKKQDGTEVPEVTQWHNIIAWRQLAEMCAKYVRKGMKVAVDGEIVYDKYTKQGIECLAVDIVADDVVLMQKPRDGEMRDEPSAVQMQQPQQRTAPQQMTLPGLGVQTGNDDDLPF